MIVGNHKKQFITNGKEFDGNCSFGGNVLKLFKEVKTLFAVCREIENLGDSRNIVVLFAIVVQHYRLFTTEITPF